MEASRFLRRISLAIILSVTLGAYAQAQPAKQEYQPQVGQEGKDAMFLRSSQGARGDGDGQPQPEGQGHPDGPLAHPSARHACLRRGKVTVASSPCQDGSRG